MKAVPLYTGGTGGLAATRSSGAVSNGVARVNSSIKGSFRRSSMNMVEEFRRPGRSHRKQRSKAFGACRPGSKVLK